MTWANRFRLMVGLIVVLFVVAACTLVFTQRQAIARSTSAQITAQQYSAGSMYAGTVVKQLVNAGDTVTAGAPLFEVRSAPLARDIATKAVTRADVGTPVSKNGTFTVTSTVAGTVADVHSPVGDFVQSGQVLAHVDRAASMKVAAEFHLTARDYGRIEQGSAVDLLLPNDRTVAGRVDQIDVDTVAGQATSVITVKSAALTARPIGGLYEPGTPIIATLHLRDDGPLAGTSDAFGDFLRKIGL